MRILILTHPRSGGMSLMSWISNEKDYTSYHEPKLNDDILKHTIMTENNIVVKMFPQNIKSEEFENFINSFDKVIVHKRDNITDVSISLLYGDINEDFNMHTTYNMDDKWKEEHNNQIEHYKTIVNELYDRLNNIPVSKCIHTTYESIYINKEDVNVICNYLNIFNPRWLDIIDKKRRLQNGAAGMKGYKQSIQVANKNRTII